MFVTYQKCFQNRPPSLQGPLDLSQRVEAQYATPQFWEFWEPSVEDFAFRKGQDFVPTNTTSNDNLKSRLPVLFNVEAQEREVYQSCNPQYLATRPVQYCPR